MARALIVGCGCRGRALADALAGDGHAVRGTTRDPSRLAALEEAGIEAVACDPDRLGTLLPAIEGVSLVFWLLGTASGPQETLGAIHGARLESLMAALVDTPVRGVAYEGAGTVAPATLDRGAGIVRRAARTHRIRVEVLTRYPADRGAWLEEARSAAGRLLAPSS